LISAVADAYTPDECRNYFKHAGDAPVIKKILGIFALAVLSEGFKEYVNG
jgi:hypothetical protein